MVCSHDILFYDFVHLAYFRLLFLCVKTCLFDTNYGLKKAQLIQVLLVGSIKQILYLQKIMMVLFAVIKGLSFPPIRLD